MRLQAGKVVAAAGVLVGRSYEQMEGFIPYGRQTWTAVVLVVFALITVSAGLGVGQRNGSTLWTEGPIRGALASDDRPLWVGLAKALKPSVVNISSERFVDGTDTDARSGEEDSRRESFRRSSDDPQRTVRSVGSGFIINADGYILTNNHVVDKSTDVRVTLSDGREFAAQVVGHDAKMDLALLKIEARGLPVIPLGDSSQLEVGEPVMAIGSPFSLEQTVTAGIVSAIDRVIGDGPYDDFIQIDAPINPGNSGGPLINTRGEAVGINTAMFSETGGSIGIGFAIPINTAKSVVSQLASSGHVVRGWLGISVQPVTPDLAKAFQLPDTRGALVDSVADGSPAMHAGLKPGDVITQYDSFKVARAESLPGVVAETPVGRHVPIRVVRQGHRLTLTATIGRLVEGEE